MAKRERKNARLQTNFTAETQAVQAPAGAADDGGRTAEPATAATTAEADQPGGTATAAGTDQGSGAEGGAVANGAAAGGGTGGDGDVARGGAGTELGGVTYQLGLDPDEELEVSREGSARLAAVNAYLGTGFHIGLFDQAIEWEPAAPHFVAAAEFILAERTSPAEAIPIQLALKKLGGSMSPGAQEVMLWSGFRDVFLRVFDHLKAMDDAENAALAAAIEFGNQGGLPLDRALEPQPGAFDPQSGFSPRV